MPISSGEEGWIYTYGEEPKEPDPEPEPDPLHEIFQIWK